MIRRISDSGTWYCAEYFAISPSTARGLPGDGRISASATACGASCRGRMLLSCGDTVPAQPLSSPAVSPAVMIRPKTCNRPTPCDNLDPGLLALCERPGNREI